MIGALYTLLFVGGEAEPKKEDSGGIWAAQVQSVREAARLQRLAKKRPAQREPEPLAEQLAAIRVDLSRAPEPIRVNRDAMQEIDRAIRSFRGAETAIVEGRSVIRAAEARARAQQASNAQRARALVALLQAWQG